MYYCVRIKTTSGPHLTEKKKKEPAMCTQYRI